MTWPAEPVPAVERYLAEVTVRLPGSPRAQSGIVSELRSGLLDAADARRSAGLAPAAAVQAAIREFGDPAEVADAFRAEISASLARRVAIAMLASGPLVGLLWIAAAATSHLGSRAQWASLPASLQAGMLLVAVAVAVTACGALCGIAVTGQLTRWLRVRPGLAPTAAAVAGFAAVAADALGLGLFGVLLATAPGELSPLLAAAAAAASVVRIVLARRAARHCLALRASLA